jgi:hypothetical protein
MNASLQQAIDTKNVKVIADLTYKHPELLTQKNAKGENPLQAYRNSGGRNQGILWSLVPSFEPDWVRPAWYGLPGAWSNAFW